MLPKEMIEKLAELHVKPYFYYDRSRPLVATICLLLNGQTFISRGVALCSWKDEFNKYTGRTKACGRHIEGVTGWDKDYEPELHAGEVTHEGKVWRYNIKGRQNPNKLNSCLPNQMAQSGLEFQDTVLVKVGKTGVIKTEQMRKSQ